MIVVRVQSEGIWVELQWASCARYPPFRSRHALVVVIIFVLFILFDKDRERSGAAGIDSRFRNADCPSLGFRISSTGLTLLRAS